MKKQILLMGLACFLFAGSQVTFAQSKKDQQSFTMKSTKDVVNKSADDVIGMFERGAQLNDDQKDRVRQVFAAVEEKKKNIESITDEKEKNSKTALLQNFINEKLMDVLSPDQYKTYIKSMSR